MRAPAASSCSRNRLLRQIPLPLRPAHVGAQAVPRRGFAASCQPADSLLAPAGRTLINPPPHAPTAPLPAAERRRPSIAPPRQRGDRNTHDPQARSRAAPPPQPIPSPPQPGPRGCCQGVAGTPGTKPHLGISLPRPSRAKCRGPAAPSPTPTLPTTHPPPSPPPRPNHTRPPNPNPRILPQPYRHPAAESECHAPKAPASDSTRSERQRGPFGVVRVICLLIPNEHVPTTDHAVFFGGWRHGVVGDGVEGSRGGIFFGS